jgi:CubicO group peptidase (beta-lactamase class C family)
MAFANAEAASQQLQSILSSVTQDESTSVPGLSFIVVSKDGSPLFQHSAGTRGVGTSEALTNDSVFWIASCTKAVATIAVLQVVEKGLLSLDDSEQLEGLLPELKELQVLKADGTTEPKKKGITLRQLLTHTAGFGYSFFNERLRDWSFPAGIDEFSGDVEDIKQPLLFQPGEGWEYGVSVEGGCVDLSEMRLSDARSR